MIEVLLTAGICLLILSLCYLTYANLAWLAREEAELEAEILSVGASKAEARAIMSVPLARKVPLDTRDDVEHALDVRAWVMTHKLKEDTTLEDVERAMGFY